MSATCCPCVTLFTAELRIFCAAAAGKVTQASAPVHRGAISIDRSTVTRCMSEGGDIPCFTFAIFYNKIVHRISLFTAGLSTCCPAAVRRKDGLYVLKRREESVYALE